MKGSVSIKLKQYDQELKEYVSITIAQLHNGSAFGELALLENKKRSATIICNTKCVFAILDKHNYQRILGVTQLNNEFKFSFC